MCRGDNDNDTSSDNSKQSGTGMSPGESQAKFGNTDQAGKAPDVSNYGDMSKDDYVADVLSYEGYSDTYKGVSSGSGGSVTDGQGNPVRSGSYVDTMNRADATYDSYQDYQAARAEAQENFYSDMEARQQVDQGLINTAMGMGGYIGGGFYNPDGTINENFDPTSVSNMQGPASLQQLSDYGSFLGSSADTFSFPGYSFADPLGTAMAPTLSQIDGSA